MEIEILNIDCIEYMKTCKDNKFDLAVVDVPYGIGESMKDNASRGKARGGLNNSAWGYSKAYTKKDWDKEPPSNEYFKQLFRVSKNQIIFGANHFIEMINKNSSCWIVWDKDNGCNDFADCELAWTSFKTAVRKVKYRWHGMLQGDMKNKEKRIHPTQKPVNLYKWIFDTYTKSGQTILDTHLGSGSSAIAAYYSGLDFIGCEIDKEYYDNAINRYENETAQIKLF